MEGTWNVESGVGDGCGESGHGTDHGFAKRSLGKILEQVSRSLSSCVCVSSRCVSLWNYMWSVLCRNVPHSFPFLKFKKQTTGGPNCQICHVLSFRTNANCRSHARIALNCPRIAVRIAEWRPELPSELPSGPLSKLRATRIFSRLRTRHALRPWE